MYPLSLSRAESVTIPLLGPRNLNSPDDPNYNGVRLLSTAGRRRIGAGGAAVMASDIGAVLAVVAAHGDGLRHSVDVGLAVIGSVLGDPAIYGRSDGRRLICCDSGGSSVSRLRRSSYGWYIYRRRIDRFSPDHRVGREIILRGLKRDRRMRPAGGAADQENRKGAEG